MWLVLVPFYIRKQRETKEFNTFRRSNTSMVLISRFFTNEAPGETHFGVQYAYTQRPIILPCVGLFFWAWVLFTITSTLSYRRAYWLRTLFLQRTLSLDPQEFRLHREAGVLDRGGQYNIQYRCLSIPRYIICRARVITTFGCYVTF